MAFPGWMTFGGKEIINIERTVTYVQALMPQLQVAPARNCEQVLHQVLGHTTAYTTPLDDNCDWYDPKVPESHGFAGLYPLEITGLDDDVRTAEVTQGNFDGGFISPPRRKTREVHVSGLLIGENEQCVDYGLFWLRQVLDADVRAPKVGRMDPTGSETMASIPDLCGDEKGDVNYLASCPELGCGKHCGHMSGKETAHPVTLSTLVPSNGTFQRIGANWVFTPNGVGTLATPLLPDTQTCPVRYEWALLGTVGSTVAGQGIRDGELRSVTTMDLVARRSNLVENPQWKASAGAVTVRKNLAVNPSLRTLCTPTLVTTNRVPNPRMGTNTSGYTLSPGTGGTAAQTRVTTGGPLPSAPTFCRQTWSVAQTAFTAVPYTGVGVNGDATYSIAVAAGEKISASVYVRTSLANQNYALQLAYYTGAGAQVGSTVIGPTITPSANTWTFMGITDPGTVPATATQVRFLVAMMSGTVFGVGATLDTTAYELVRNQPLLPYFDGASTARGGQTYAWAGTAHASASTATGYENLNRTNSVQNAACRTGITGYGVDSGGGTVNLIYGTDSTLVLNGSAITTYFRANWTVSPTDPTSADIWYGRNAISDIRVQQGQAMMFSCYARSNVFDRIMYLEVTYYGDDGVVSLGVRTSGPFAIGGTQFTRMSLFDSNRVPLGATHARMKLKMYSGLPINALDTIDMTAVLSEITYDGVLGSFFDGATPDTATVDYDWAGTTGASSSYARAIQAAGRTVARTNWFLNPDQNALYPSGVTSVSTPLYPVTQDATLNRALTTRSSSSPSGTVSSVNIDGGATVIPAAVGDIWTLSCDVWTTADDRSYSAQVNFLPSGNGTATGGIIPTAASTVGPIRVVATGTAPAGTTSVYLRVTVTTNSGNAPTNEIVYYDKVLFEKCSGARVYFSGDFISPSESGLACQWEGAPYMSRSLALGPCINTTLVGVNNTPFWQTDNVSPAGGAVGSVFVIGDSGTGTDLIAPLRTNLAKNPVARAQSGTVEVKRNRCLNPNGRALVTATEFRRNYVPQPRAQSTTGWFASYGTTGAGTLAAQTGTGPVTGVTTWNRMTWTTAATAANANITYGSTTSSPTIEIPVTAGDPLTASIWVRTSVTGQQFQINAQPYDSGGATVGSALLGTSTTLVANTWTRLSVSSTVPTNAVRATVRVQQVSGVLFTIGATLDVSAVLWEKSAALFDYFDGTFTSTDMWAYSWVGTADQSASRIMSSTVEVRRNYFPTTMRNVTTSTSTLRTNLATNPRYTTTGAGWLTNNGANWVMSADTSIYHSATQSALSTPQAPVIGAATTLLSIYNVGGAAFAATVGKVYTGSCWVRHNTNVAATGKIGYAFLDSGSVIIGSTVYSGNFAMAQNTWTRINVTTPAAPANTAFVRFIVQIDRPAGSNVVAGDLAWADDFLLEEGPALLPYFDGATLPAGDTSYIAPAQAQPTTTTGWSGMGFALTTAPWDPSRQCIRITGTGAGTAYTFSAGSTRALWEAGVRVTVSCTVQAPVGVWFQPYVHNNTGNLYYGGSIVTPTMQATGVPQRVSATWTMAADDLNGNTLNMAVLWYSGPSTANNLAAGVNCYMGDVVIEEAQYPQPYFETALGGTAVWSGTADASTSIYRALGHNNLSAYASVSNAESAPFRVNEINYLGQPQAFTRVQSVTGNSINGGIRNISGMTAALGNAVVGPKRVYVRAKVRFDAWSGWTNTNNVVFIGRDDANNDSTLFNTGTGTQFTVPAAARDGMTWTECVGYYDIPSGRNLEAVYIAPGASTSIPQTVGVEFADISVTTVPGRFFDGAIADRVNLFTNPSVETTLTPWAAWLGTGSPAGTTTRIVASDGVRGTAYARVQWTTPPNANSGGIFYNQLVTVLPGVTYTYSAWVRCSAAVTITPQHQWYNSGSATTGGLGTSTAIPANTWTRVSGTGICPLNSNQIQVRFYISVGTLAANDTLDLDAGLLEPYTALDDYYEGTRVDYQFAGNAEASASVAYSKAPGSWSLTAPGNVIQGPMNDHGGYWIDTRGTAVAFSAVPTTVTTVGQFFSGRVAVRYIAAESYPTSGITPGVRVQIHDGSGYIAGSASYVNLPSDGSPLTIEAISTAACTNTAPRLYVYPTEAGVSLRFTDAVLEMVPAANYPATDSPMYYDGYTTATPDLTYSWTGTPDTSEAIATGIKPVVDTMSNPPSFPAVYVSSSHTVAAGEFAFAIMPGGFIDLNRAAGDTTLNGHNLGASTISMTAYRATSPTAVSAQSMALMLFAKPSGGSFSHVDTIITSPVNGVISATGTAPAGSACVFWRIQNYIGEPLYVTEVLIENIASVGTYFDGSYPDTLANSYDWSGTPDQSWSTYSQLSRLILQGAGDTLVTPANWYAAKFKVRQIGGTPDAGNTIHVEGHYYGGGEDYGMAVAPQDVVVTSAWQEVCLPARMIAPSTPSPGLQWDQVSPSTTWDSVGTSATWDTYTGP